MQGALSTLLLLPTPCLCSRPFKIGSWVFWSFGIFWSRICPNHECTWLFLVPFGLGGFLCVCVCILLLEASCVQVRALQPCLRGSQVPACLPSSVAGLEQGPKRLPQPGAGGPGSRRAVGAPSRLRRGTGFGPSAWKGDASSETRSRVS